MSDSPTITDDGLGFDVVSYAREIVSTPSHHDADEFSACARETLAAMLAAWDRLSERHDTLFRNHAFLMATKIPPTVVSMPAPPADAAREAVREAAERLLEDYAGVEDMLLSETAEKVMRLRSALSAPAPAPSAKEGRRRCICGCPASEHEVENGTLRLLLTQTQRDRDAYERERDEATQELAMVKAAYLSACGLVASMHAAPSTHALRRCEQGGTE